MARRRSLGDAPGASCSDSVTEWERRARTAVREGQDALQSGDPTTLLGAARELHFVAGMVSGSCTIRSAVLSDPMLKRFYPQVYLTQDKIQMVHRRLLHGGRLNEIGDLDLVPLAPAAAGAIARAIPYLLTLRRYACTSGGVQMLRRYLLGLCGMSKWQWAGAILVTGGAFAGAAPGAYLICSLKGGDPGGSAAFVDRVLDALCAPSTQAATERLQGVLSEQAARAAAPPPPRQIAAAPRRRADL